MPREVDYVPGDFDEGDPAPLCCHKLCAMPAEYQVVVCLRAKNYHGPPLKVRPAVLVCPDHRPTIPDPFISDDDWLKLVEHVVGQGGQRPHRISTTVEYEPLPKAPVLQ